MQVLFLAHFICRLSDILNKYNALSCAIFAGKQFMKPISRSAVIKKQMEIYISNVIN